MRLSIVLALLLAVSFLAGCIGDEGDQDQGTSQDTDDNDGSEGNSTQDEAPEPLVFSYGPSAGCIGDFAMCLSAEQGPDGQPIDGFWQELDERYWGLDFTVHAPTALGDTDCTAYDEDQEVIDVDLNGGAGPCEGPLPDETKWLFLYSYAEPSPSLELEFSSP